MDEEVTMYRIAHIFEVEVERNDEEEGKERRYLACCGRLSGCRVYASSKAKALRKIRQAIGIWLDLADRHLADEQLEIEDLLGSIIPD